VDQSAIEVEVDSVANLLAAVEVIKFLVALPVRSKRR